MIANQEIATDVTSFDILTEGEKIDSTYSIKSIITNKEANRIAYAQIILFDGGRASEGFKVSNANEFIPGNTIEIRAGYHFKNTTIFKGIITKHSIKKTEKRFELIINCKHPAVNMSIGKKSKYFYNVKDSELIEELVQPYDISIQAASTKVTHKAMVQYQVTDWEFMIMRAGANGQLIFTHDDEIEVVAPDSMLTPVLTLDTGSIMEIESEMDALSQLKKVSAAAWDPAEQKVIKAEASPRQQNEQGNIKAITLAEVTKHEMYEMRYTGNIEDTELEALANARLLKSNLAKIKGRIKCQGKATIQPGDVAEIKGIGERFNGAVYITGIRHSINDKNWKTDLQFGLSPQWYGTPISGKNSSHTMLSSISGLHIGIVVQLEDDPLGEDRILIRTPLISEDETGTWARVNSLDAGENRGAFFRPEIDDEVIIGFIDNDPRHAVVLGMLNSSAKPAPIKATDENSEKGFITREELKLLFNDEKKAVAIETPNSNIITISDEDGGISLEDENGNSMLMNADGITLESGKDLILKATGDITLEGVNIEVTASAELKGEGSAGAELSAGGNTVIKGATVMIN